MNVLQFNERRIRITFKRITFRFSELNLLYENLKNFLFYFFFFRNFDIEILVF